jgi:hypothetical protein
VKEWLDVRKLRGNVQSSKVVKVDGTREATKAANQLSVVLSGIERQARDNDK